MVTAAGTADEPLDSQPAPAGRALLYAAIVIVVGIFATTLAQPQVLGRLPLQNMLKNELHISRTASAGFFFLCGLPWYAKPLAGIFTDAFPILGSRRKSYALISVALGVVAWGVLFFTPHDYGKLLWVCLGINAFMMVTSTVVGAYMVETAQAAAMSGRLTALRNFVDQVCLMIRGPVAGVLASVAFGWTAVACGSVLALLFPVALFVLVEQRRRIPPELVLAEAGARLVRIVRAWPMWLVAVVMVAFYLVPGLSTAIFYKQQNDLHMTAAFQGTVIYPISAGFGIAAAAIYAWVCRRVQLHWLLLASIAASAVTGAAYVFYTSIPNAIALTAVYAFAFTFAELAFMDLAIRATPKGCEGMGFSALMSVRNICIFGADVYGSALLDKHIFSFNQLVLTSAGLTGAVVILAWFVPHHLVRRKDAEIYERAAMPPDELEPA